MTEEQVAKWREERLEWTQQFRRCNHHRQSDHHDNPLPCVERGCPEEYRGFPELKIIKYPNDVRLTFDPAAPAPIHLDVVLYRRLRDRHGRDFWSSL